ncbi:conserved hypothetical protein [Ricinus communis]|uniref:Reverse transcriptase zinc-binding domain-containing protein n=1 Tax=Ricinus communis TaxID=3988 RepID=B9SQZ3_RICCO|nr:conserved hypothetical protein [Ricinus communis]
MNLARRGIRVPPNCQVYGKEDESIEHMLFFCQHAHLTWFTSSSSYKLDPNGFKS